MEITHQIKDKIGIFWIDGIFAESQLKRIRSYIEPFVEDSSVEGIIFDFEKVEYVDSSGVGMLVAWYRDLKEQKRQFVLCRVKTDIYKMFELVGISALISIVATEKEALESCQ